MYLTIHVFLTISIHKKLGHCVKCKKKSECSDFQISYIVEHRKHTKYLNGENVQLYVPQFISIIM